MRGFLCFFGPNYQINRATPFGKFQKIWAVVSVSLFGCTRTFERVFLPPRQILGLVHKYPYTIDSATFLSGCGYRPHKIIIIIIIIIVIIIIIIIIIIIKPSSLP